MTTPSLKIGGSSVGLPSEASVYISSGSGGVSVSGSETFQLPQSFASGEAYSLSISAQPRRYQCTLSNATGIVGSGNVTNVSIACVPRPLTRFIYVAGNNLTLTLQGGPATNCAILKQPIDTAGALGTPSFAYVGTTGFCPTGLIQSADSTRLYLIAGDQASDKFLQAFSVDPTTGDLTPLGQAVLLGTNQNGYSVVLSASGTFAHATDGMKIVTYRLNTPGGTPVQTSALAVSSAEGCPGLVACDLSSLAVFRDGFVYLLTAYTKTQNQYSSRIAAYSVDPSSGALTSLTAASAPAFETPGQLFSAVVNPVADDLYAIVVSNSSPATDNLEAFSIDPRSGAVNLAQTEVPNGLASLTLGIDPAGATLYSSSYFYLIDPSSGMVGPGTPLGVAVQPGALSSTVGVDPSGRWLFGTGYTCGCAGINPTLSVFLAGAAIDPATGNTYQPEVPGFGWGGWGSPYFAP